MTNTRTLLVTSLVGLTVLTALAGCDNPPTLRHYLVLPVRYVEVPADKPEAQKLTSRVEAARIEYDRRLRLLHRFYVANGDILRTQWVRREHENLRRAQTFKWVGIAAVPPQDATLPADTNEGTLAEDVAVARHEYLLALREAEDYYGRHGPTLNGKASRNILRRFDGVRTYLYLDSAEFPPLDLAPNETIPEAEQLYADAYRIYDEGLGWLRTFLTTSYTKQREALTRFKLLVNHHPTSSKAPEAAFFIGEIYKEYFDEDLRAVNWYQRAWTWDPDIHQPARYQAAVVYDLRLNDKLRALELYREALEHEDFNKSNVKFATKRIAEIQDDAAQFKVRLTPPGEPPPEGPLPDGPLAPPERPGEPPAPEETPGQPLAPLAPLGGETD